MSRPRNFAQLYRAALTHPTRSRWLTSSTVPTYVPCEKIRALRAHKITKTRQGTKLTHFADSTDTRPSFGPSLSKITECGHLRRTHHGRYNKNTGQSGSKWRGMTSTHLKVSINPGLYTAPQLKYLTSGTLGVCSLNSRMACGVRDENAEPSPPPLGSNSRSERNDGKRSGPTVSRK